MGYLRTHWHGEQPLGRSFWINFVLLLTIIILAEPTLRQIGATHAWLTRPLAIAYLLIGHGLVLIWQIVGLLRACRRRLSESGDFVPVTMAQFTVLPAVIATITAVSTILQTLFGPNLPSRLELARDAVEHHVPGYELQLIAAGSLIRIDGSFDIGLSRDLEQLLADAPSVSGIILHSHGGRIFEARGVANLIREHQLATYVFEICQSACTTAFIAGTPRRLGKSGRVGFHSYRLDGLMPVIDMTKEQAKDRLFFETQGVAPSLLKQAFATPPEAMWYPTQDELLSAHVVHELIDGNVY